MTLFHTRNSTTATYSQTAKVPTKGGGIKSQFDILVDRINANVKEGLGMSNGLLERLCRRETTQDFKGVFSADQIPTRLSACSKFIIVVNLGRSNQQDGHFVAICGDPDRMYYFDSYALPCFQPDVNKFIRECRRPIISLTKRIQGFKSVYCGFYAMMFALYHDKKPDFELLFSESDFNANDDTCVRYLRKLIYHED